MHCNFRSDDACYAKVCEGTTDEPAAEHSVIARYLLRRVSASHSGHQVSQADLRYGWRHVRKHAKLVVSQHINALVIRSQVVYLFAENLGPEVLADELDHFKQILEAGAIASVPASLRGN